MNQQFHVFVIRLFIFTLVIALLGFLTFYLLPAGCYSPTFPFLLVFFAAVTLITHKVILKALDKRPVKFVNYFLLTTFIKLFFFLAVMVIYALLNREDAIRFIIIYFVLYLFYTVFDVVSIYKTIGRSKSEDQDS